MARFYRSEDGVKVWYSHLKGEKTCMVFLHGLTGSSSAWHYIVPHFRKEGHSILTVDFRGHGLSDRPQNSEQLKLSLIAEDLFQILKIEKIKKIILIGHCYGGYVIQEFYKMHPSYVKKMIAISSSPSITSRGFLMPKAVYLFYSLLFRVAWRLHFEKNKVHVDYSRFKESKDIDFSRLYTDIRTTSFQTFLTLYKELITKDYADSIAAIKVPFLIIHGENDIFFSKKEAVRMHELSDKSELFLVKSGHIPLLTCPKELITIISGFV